MIDTVVVILNWNGLKFLSPCIGSLLNQTYKTYKIIIVDNGSEDGSVAFLKQNYPQADIIELSHNTGFATGNNIGFRYAEKKYNPNYFIAINNDTISDKNLIEEMVKAAQDQKVGMVAAKIVLQDNPTLLDSAGHGVLRSGLIYSRGRMQNESLFSENCFVFGPCGGAALYTKEFFKDVGMFDDDFFAYYEDADLSWRGILAGWLCAYNPKAIIYHKLHGTSNRKYKFLVLSERNRLLIIIKNYPTNFILRNIFSVVLQELKLLINDQNYIKSFINIPIRLMAVILLILQLPKTLKKRRLIQKKSRISYDEIMNHAKLDQSPL